jgi:hypothetical protein
MRDRLIGAAVFSAAAAMVVACIVSTPVFPPDPRGLRYLDVFFLVLPPVCAGVMGGKYGGALVSSVVAADGYTKSANIGARVASWSWIVYGLLICVPPLPSPVGAEDSWSDQLIRSLLGAAGISIIMLPVLAVIGAVAGMAYVWVGRRVMR